jgi:hypothetical protein
VDPKRNPQARTGSVPPSVPPPRRPGAVPAGGAAAGAVPAAGAAGIVGVTGATGAKGAPPKTPTLGETIDRVSADVQQLRVDFERFFSGALLFPPEDLRQRVQAQLRGLRNANAATAVERFRLGDIEARFIAYNELFNRRLRDREEGRKRAPQAPPPPAQRYDPAAGIVIGLHPSAAAVEALYAGLAGGGADGPRFDLTTFGTYLQRQAAAIRDKTGCEEVNFRLAVEDGKLKLKARPVGGARTPRS